MSQRSRTEYSLLNIATGVGGYVLSVLLSLINRMVFTRCLPAAYLGVSGLFGNVLAMLSLAELGVGGAISYALYKPLAEKDEEKIASLMKVFGTAYRTVGLVMLAAGICVMPFLNMVVGQQPQIRESIHLIYLIFLAGSAGSYFFTYRSTLLTAAQKNYLCTGLNYLVQCVQSVVQAVFLYRTRNYMGYLVIQLSFSMLYYLWISRIAVKQYPYIARKNVKPLAPEERKKIFRDMRDLMFYKVSGVLVNSTDNIIITYFSGLIATGMTSNYTLLVNTLNTLLNQVFGGITASIGNHNVLESEESKYNMYRFLNLVNFWLFGWGTLGIVFCSSDLVCALFGSEYCLPANIPAVLAASFYLSGITNVIGTYKHTMGLFRHGRFTQFFTALLNMVFSIGLGHLWGVFGILLATVIARVCTHLWYTPVVVYKYGFKRKVSEYFAGYVLQLLVLSAAGLLCWPVMKWITGQSVAAVLAKMAACSVITNLVFAAAYFRTQEFKKLTHYAQMLVQRIRKK